MSNEYFSHVSMMRQEDIYFSRKVQIVHAKMDWYVNLPNYSLFSTQSRYMIKLI